MHQHPPVPTRSTSYTHLRDGFVKTMLARVKLAKDRGTLSQEQEHVRRAVPSSRAHR